MFERLRVQSRSASGAIKYVTIGVLMMIWAGLWYYYFLRPYPEAPLWQRYLCVGTIFSGLAIIAIGLLFGQIGRGAKAADETVGVATTQPGAVASVTPAARTITTPATSVAPATAAVVASPRRV